MAIQTSRGPRRIISEINITPLTDVALVLLVIFMVTAPLIVQTGFSVKLPEATTASSQPTSPIVITIAADSSLYLNNVPVTRDSLVSLLQIRVRQGGAGAIAVIEADRSVPHGTVVDAMDLVRKSGIERLAISAEFKPEVQR
jgi:biopolymer transport protein TolR